MTQVIWKFSLGLESAPILMPKGAQVLTVQVQHEQPCVWMLVDPASPRVSRRFRTYGTGHEWDTISGVYVGTYQLDSFLLVFHVFDEGEVTP